MRYNEFKKSKDEAVVQFSDKAFTKLITLVMMCNKEVGWHGTTRKIDKGLYYIDDIFLYPQTVSAASIRCEKNGLDYGRWEQMLILEQPERAEARRFHGHSHVDMPCVPSSVDIDLQKDILKMTPDDGFYIFLIINKSLDMFWLICDGEDKVIYSKDNVGLYNDSMYSIMREHSDYVKEVTNGH